MLVFLNSYKMKQAIIFGVVQMLFGIILSTYNHVYFGNKMSILFEVVPQVIFLSSLFGYLVVLIIYKWISPRDVSLLNTLIFMILKFGSPIEKQNELYSGQVSGCRGCLMSP